MLTFKLRRLPARYAAVLMPCILSIMMTCVVSFIATLKAVGFHDGIQGLITLWLGAWPLSWLIAFPTLLLVMPVVRRVVALIVLPYDR